MVFSRKWRIGNKIALTSSKLKSQKNMLWGPEWGGRNGGKFHN